MPAVRDAVLKSLSLKIVDDMKKTDPKGKYKLRNNFIVELLVHLKQKNSFEEYYRFLTDFESFSKDWLHDRVIAHCKEQSGGKIKFTHLAKEILTEITDEAKKVVRDAVTQNISGNAKSFLDLFVEKLKTRITMSKDEMKIGLSLADSNAKKFAETVLPSIAEIEKLLLHEITGWNVETKIKDLSVKPNEELFKGLFCCTKKCPFCGAFCESETIEHAQHFSKQHRPEGLNSYRWIQTQHLAMEICTALVAGNATFQNRDTNQKWISYKDYQTVNDYYKSWIIQRDPSAEATSYWKKVFHTFNKEFADRYGAKPAEIGNAWDIGWDKVKEDLNKTYNTNIQSL
ncbi:interferon-induced very large GTPase 1-like [Scyliorhinus torazame]|uniref:VLIG-type G domain-containing protein n=1 Tax=Scyliorhinus torazame TaxID=75743 RepID=A0A401Q1A3_SCYTO|nr:hypothetical protein [Scyliorhinus torazame]